MRVGYVLKKFPRISETFILNEILELERQGAEVTVFSLHRPDDGVFHESLASLARPVVYLPLRKTADQLAHLRANLPLLTGARDGAFDEFKGLLAAGRPDLWSILRWALDVAVEARAREITHLHAHFATIATYVARAVHSMTGIPYSFTCHAKDIYREGVSAELFERLASPAAFAVTVCDANRRHIVERLVDEKKARIARLYNGVDLDTFHPSSRRPDAVPLVLAVGRLVEKKGFAYLIEAAASLAAAGREFRCAIVGEGEERHRLEELIAAKRLENVELLGIRTHDEVRDLLARSTVLALPCVIGEDGNRDALPTVLLEALASGVPVVSTPVAGVEEIVDDGRAGILVPMRDAPALCDAIAGLLDDPGRRADLGAAGRARAEACFDLHANVERLLAWFEAGRAETT